MTIDGKAVAGTASFDVVDPATGEAFLTAPEASNADLDRAVEAAAGAFGAWRNSDDETRRGALRRSADVVEAAVDELAPLLTAEQGKPLAWSRIEVRGSAMWLRYYADLERSREIVQDDERGLAEIVRRPFGPVAAIAPWNYPLLLSAAKIGPALRAGNTMVLKPSPHTPLSSLRMGELLREVFPPGVLNVLSGGDQLGAALTTHPLIRKIAFTGSTATGKKIAAAAGADLKHLTLELGGNDAAIVLDDADVERTAQLIFATAFNNSGQACLAPKRVYADQAVLPHLVEALAELARAAKVGSGMDPDTELGPLNNRAQFERVVGLVADATDRGAKVVTGGQAIPGTGYFYEPTILTDADDAMAIVAEEQFGPALPVLGFRDLDDAVERANATQYGLGASVWSTDSERAAAVATRLDAGMSWINTHTPGGPHLPFPGIKHSAVGIEGGPWGLDSYSDLRLIYTAR